ncbi:hypothetical protein V8E36_002800 [Tilletia maclaganii]
MRTRDGRIIDMQVVREDDEGNRRDLPGGAHKTKTDTTTVHHMHVNHQLLNLTDSGAWAASPTDFHLHTKRKTVAEKIKPSQSPPSSGYVHQPLRPVPHDRDPYDTPVRPDMPPFQPTGKLTTDRIAGLNFGPPGFVNKAEKNMLLWVLHWREAVLGYDISDIRFVNPAVMDDYHINTVPHQPWEKRHLRAFTEPLHATGNGPDASPHPPARSSAPGNPPAVRFIIDMQEANKVTVRDANAPPYLYDYVDGFVGCTSYGVSPSRQLASFRTPRGLLQLTTLAPGATNSPAVAQRLSDHVGAEDVPDNFCAFVDDYGIKGPRSYYNQETMGGTEYAIIFERLLYRLESAHLVINAKKMTVITDELDITGIKVSFRDKRPDPRKVDALHNWENPCRSQASLRAFLGLLNFLRAHIPWLAELDAPLRCMTGKEWEWHDGMTVAMDNIKAVISKESFLRVLDYFSGDEIVLAVDSSSIATGYVLYQERPTGRVVILYGSIGFTEVESRYSHPKLELCGVYKAVRACHYHLLGVPFTLAVDAKALVYQLNRPHLAAPVEARWIANLLNYQVHPKHVPAKDHVLPDALSRMKMDNVVAADADPEELRPFTAASHRLPSDPPSVAIPFRTDCYTGLLRLLGLWLASAGTHPDLAGISQPERRWIRSRLRRFLRHADGVPLLVIGTDEERITALNLAHDELGHRGRDALADLLGRRVWHVRSCHHRTTELQRAAPIPRLFETFALDLVDLGSTVGPRRYLVLARCLLTGWLSSSVAAFISDDILSRYGPVIHTILTDNGPENAADVDALLLRLGGNAVVERGLLKVAYDDRLRTYAYLPLVLWADRITTRRRDDDLAVAAQRLRESREQSRFHTDTVNADKLRDALAPETMVLLAPAAKMLPKAASRWIGPYIIDQQLESGSYMLREVDGTPLVQPIGADRLRRYWVRPRHHVDDRAFLDDAADHVWDHAPAPTPANPLPTAGPPHTIMDPDLPQPEVNEDSAAHTDLDQLPFHPTAPEAATPPGPVSQKGGGGREMW